MAGIYLHVPFCKKACHYCDFHFSTSLQRKEDMTAAMLRELDLRRDYLSGEGIDTVYFGGGTPSLLGSDAISRLIGRIAEHHELATDAEITLEANPDDLDRAQVAALRATPVNRFSIGIQSFFEEDLRWMNRAHSAAEAESAVKRVQDAGFENLTADLIYGYPLLSDAKWTENFNRLIGYGVPHLSAYAMTVEPRTALATFIKQGAQPAMDETQSAAQLLFLAGHSAAAGYEHYEISNFARPGRYSRHNTNYWNGVSYLGIGPSAHSFDGRSRQWNVAHNSKYLEAISANGIPAEREELSTNDRFNEYVMTGLRLSRGISREKIQRDFGSDYLAETERNIGEYLANGKVELVEDTYRLTLAGKLFADGIAAGVMVVG